MVRTTALGASVIAVAVVYTLVAPFLADVERKSLRVLSDVGRDAVFANTSVAQLVRVAIIFLSSQGGNTGLLEADKRTLSLVLVAPVLPV